MAGQVVAILDLTGSVSSAILDQTGSGNFANFHKHSITVNIPSGGHLEFYRKSGGGHLEFDRKCVISHLGSNRRWQHLIHC